MFRNVDHALHWAYRERRKECLKGSSINRQYRAPRNREDVSILHMENELLLGLTAQDRQVQASQIINAARGLRPRYAAEYVAAMYGSPRPCLARVRYLTKHMMDTLHGIKNARSQRYSVALTILRYLGGEVTESRKCARLATKIMVEEEVTRVGVVAESLLTEMFKEKGII